MPRTTMSKKLRAEHRRASMTIVESLRAGAMVLPVSCISCSRVGTASSSSAARKPNAGFHALR